MKHYRPAYYDNFRCLAGNCPDTCCAGWELPVDAASQKRYAEVPGALGDRLRAAMTADPEGDVIFRQPERRCPFLTEGQLCEIRGTLGYRMTPAECRRHPMFREEYETFREDCPSLSCPAASALILSYPLRGAYPAPPISCRDEVLRILLRRRAELLSGLEETDAPEENLRRLYAAAYAAQTEICACEEEAPALPRNAAADRVDLPALLEFLFSRCEILTPAWRALLTDCRGKAVPADFGSFCFANRILLNRSLAYHIYRRFFKAVNTLSVMPVADFAAAAILFPACLSDLSDAPLSETLRLFSKEIEHDPDNVELLLQYVSAARTSSPGDTFHPL